MDKEERKKTTLVYLDCRRQEMGLSSPEIATTPFSNPDSISLSLIRTPLALGRACFLWFHLWV